MRKFSFLIKKQNKKKKTPELLRGFEELDSCFNICLPILGKTYLTFAHVEIICLIADVRSAINLTDHYKLQILLQHSLKSASYKLYNLSQRERVLKTILALL